MDNHFPPTDNPYRVESSDPSRNANRSFRSKGCLYASIVLVVLSEIEEESDFRTEGVERTN